MIEITPGKTVGYLQLGTPRGLGHGWATGVVVQNVGKKWITIVGSTMRFDVDTQESRSGPWDPTYKLVDVDDPELLRRRLRASYHRLAAELEAIGKKLHSAENAGVHDDALRRLDDVVGRLNRMNAQRGSGLPAVVSNEGEN